MLTRCKLCEPPQACMPGHIPHLASLLRGCSLWVEALLDCLLALPLHLHTRTWLQLLTSDS